MDGIKWVEEEFNNILESTHHHLYYSFYYDVPSLLFVIMFNICVTLLIFLAIWVYRTCWVDTTQQKSKQIENEDFEGNDSDLAEPLMIKASTHNVNTLRKPLMKDFR